VEYDLKYEPLKAKRGHVVADLLVDHSMEVQTEVYVMEEGTWTLFFDGSVCNQGCGIGFLVISPYGEKYEFSTRLEFECTNNQAEYEALLSRVELMIDMGARAVKIFGDSKLMVQQVNGESQCWDGVLNEYKEKCLEAFGGMDWFSIEHIPRRKNCRANKLEQRASGYDIRKGVFGKRRQPMSGDALVIQTNTDASANEGWMGGEDWRYALTEYIKKIQSAFKTIN
jgi:ribonuclease HI